MKLIDKIRDKADKLRQERREKHEYKQVRELKHIADLESSVEEIKFLRGLNWCVHGAAKKASLKIATTF